MRIEVGLGYFFSQSDQFYLPKYIKIITFVLLLGFFIKPSYAANLTDLKYKLLTDTISEVILDFDQIVDSASAFRIEEPNRIVLDIPNVINQLKRAKYEYSEGLVKMVDVVSTDYRTRLVITLNTITQYEVTHGDKQIKLKIGEAGSAYTDFNKVLDQLLGIDFHRDESGTSQIELKFNKSQTEVDVKRVGHSIIADISNTILSKALLQKIRSLDVATSIIKIDARQKGSDIELVIASMNKEFEYFTFQADRTYSIYVTNKKLAGLSDNADNSYTGEKISLNFQKVAVRSVLQQLADFSDLNLLTSDSVTGDITLRLRDVPVDMALDLVIKMSGLAKRRSGSVILVAPIEEMVKQEQQELESVIQAEDLVPLTTEYIQLKYAKAINIAAILNAKQGLLSSRGSAIVDERTNTLLLKDSLVRLDKIREAINVLDIPVRQVLIEARIVVANTSVGEELGIKWGGGFYKSNTTNLVTAGGSQQTLTEATQILADRASPDGESSALDLTAANIVDFAVSNSAASTLALGYQTADYLLDLELAAIETDGRAEIVSQPRVITADGQTASIQSGTEIPYQEASASGATSVSFRSAVLRLEVTPQITPDDRVIMDLAISQDSVGEQTTAGPSINTNTVNTQVLVDNGQTIVLGGIFRSEEVNTIRKTPFFGDLPLIGALFRHSQQSETKSELLVFITPRLVDDQISVR